MSAWTLWTAAVLLAAISSAIAVKPFGTTFRTAGARWHAFLTVLLAGIVILLAIAGARAS